MIAQINVPTYIKLLISLLFFPDRENVRDSLLTRDKTLPEYNYVLIDPTTFQL